MGSKTNLFILIATLIIATTSVQNFRHTLFAHHAETKCLAPATLDTKTNKCVCKSNQIFNETSKSCECP